MPVMEPGWREPPQGFHPRRAAPAHARAIVDTGTSRQEELPLRRNDAPLFNPVSAAWNTGLCCHASHSGVPCWTGPAA